MMLVMKEGGCDGQLCPEFIALQTSATGLRVNSIHGALDLSDV